jgi:hypothetical protein
VALRKIAQIATPAAVVVSGGNIDPAKFEKIVTSTAWSS